MESIKPSSFLVSTFPFSYDFLDNLFFSISVAHPSVKWDLRIKLRICTIKFKPFVINSLFECQSGVNPYGGVKKKKHTKNSEKHTLRALANTMPLIKSCPLLLWMEGIFAICWVPDTKIDKVIIAETEMFLLCSYLFCVFMPRWGGITRDLLLPKYILFNAPCLKSVAIVRNCKVRESGKRDEKRNLC